MLTIEEIRQRIAEIGEDVTVENQYEIARQIHEACTYPFNGFTKAQEEQLIMLPESAVSRDAWRTANDSMVNRVICTVATWQRNKAIRDIF